MGDVQVAFGILSHYFMQRFSYLLQHTFPFSIFIESFLQVFGCSLGPRSFNNLERLLTCKQTFLPITFDGIELILMTAIAPTTYLGSWALVVSIIVDRFMVYQCPYFLEALT